MYLHQCKNPLLCRASYMVVTLWSDSVGLTLSVIGCVRWYKFGILRVTFSQPRSKISEIRTPLRLVDRASAAC